MTIIRMTVNVDLRKLQKFTNVVKTDLRVSGTGPLRQAIKKWGARYRSFLQKRYLIFSRGGGSWPKLKPSTIKRKKSRLILIDTRTMINAFEPTFEGKPGQLNKAIPFGVRVGVGGEGQRHPTANGLTVRQLFTVHQFGLGIVPARETVDDPDSQTIKGMKTDMLGAIHTLTK